VSGATATPDGCTELLCETLDAQLEQQTRLAAISEAQTSALASRDVEQVDALTRALEQVVLEGPAIEQRRALATAELAAALGIDPGEATLRQLGDELPAPLRRRLEDRRSALRTSVERIRRTSAVNRSLIEGELAAIDHVMRATRRVDRISYSEDGAHAERLRALLDETA
jgi:hypothetical protein